MSKPSSASATAYFVVSRRCLNLGSWAGAPLLRQVRIEKASNELRTVIDDQARQIRRSIDSRAQIRLFPELNRLAKIIRSVGAKLFSHPPSMQKLLEFAWKHGTLPSVNGLVDAYNLASLRTRCSLGGHDLNRITLPVKLRLFDGTETFIPQGSSSNISVRPGEFSYGDAKNCAICIRYRPISEKSVLAQPARC